MVLERCWLNIIGIWRSCMFSGPWWFKCIGKTPSAPQTTSSVTTVESTRSQHFLICNLQEGRMYLHRCTYWFTWIHCISFSWFLFVSLVALNLHWQKIFFIKPLYIYHIDRMWTSSEEQWLTTIWCDYQSTPVDVHNPQVYEICRCCEIQKREPYRIVNDFDTGPSVKVVVVFIGLAVRVWWADLAFFVLLTSPVAWCFIEGVLGMSVEMGLTSQGRCP